jgi:hypothetical protein
MGDLERAEGDRAPGALDRDVTVDGVQVEYGGIGAALGLDKGIAETAEAASSCVGPSAQTGRTLAGVEDDHAQIVQPVNMVGVGMRVDHGIEHARRPRPAVVGA